MAAGGIARSRSTTLAMTRNLGARCDFRQRTQDEERSCILGWEQRSALAESMARLS